MRQSARIAFEEEPRSRRAVPANDDRVVEGGQIEPAKAEGMEYLLILF